MGPPSKSHPVLTLNEPPTAFAVLLPPASAAGPVEATLLILVALACSAFLGTLRAALARSLPARVLGDVDESEARQRLEPLLERADRLAVSASIFKIVSDLIALALLVGTIAPKDGFELIHAVTAIAIAAPVLWLVTHALPESIARARGDRLLRSVLPTFAILQLPMAWLVWLLEVVRGGVLRALHIEDDSQAARKLVEGLREVAEAAPSTELDESERELIENVLEFRDIDAAEVMVPRTEVNAVDVDTELEEVARLFGQVGHSRVPVFEDSVDNIIGTTSALAVTQALVSGTRPPLSELIRPPLLVPETMLVSGLLEAFRTGKQKMAIVVDEYGGTAGLVTLTDVLDELVDIEGEGSSVRELESGLFEVQAGLHVSEVNEALDLDIPEEEDYETLGGFVLAELGRLPARGDSFRRDEVTFRVVEASDRRVLKVHVQRSA